MAHIEVGARALRTLRGQSWQAAATKATISGSPQTEQRRATIGAQWLAKDKKTSIGEPFSVALPTTQRVEVFLPNGKIRSAPARLPLQFERDVPEGAAHLELTAGEASRVVRISSVMKTVPGGASVPKLFGPATATFVFPVFAECFDESDAFFGHVEKLYKWIVGVAPDRGVSPFNEAGVKSRFGLKAHFWKSEPSRGRFNTRVPPYDCGKNNPAIALNPGNGAARAALGELMLDGKYGLVLINSPYRGGAGGMPDDGYPAWATISSCSTEDWRAVALHEIGHGFGLADEYLDEGLAKQNRALRDEPNAATSLIPTTAPWSARLIGRPAGEKLAYSELEQRTLDSHDFDPTFVGLFQGAHYSNRYYRPSLNCLMKETTFVSFCPVCAHAIRAFVG